MQFGGSGYSFFFVLLHFLLFLSCITLHCIFTIAVCMIRQTFHNINEFQRISMEWIIFWFSAVGSSIKYGISISTSSDWWKLNCNHKNLWLSPVLLYKVDWFPNFISSSVSFCPTSYVANIQGDYTLSKYEFSI